jgi:hypothetical protein
MVRAVLGYSLAGHAVELLTITDFTAPPDAVAARECVVITARVHPGETCASWIMQVRGGGCSLDRYGAVWGSWTIHMH